MSNHLTHPDAAVRELIADAAAHAYELGLTQGAHLTRIALDTIRAEEERAASEVTS